MHLIRVKGASQHNLKNISVDIPRDKLVVITGVSGSGKSSLAFDTIYAEGQRRYVESLSAYARQFIGQMDKPDVESIEGLSPAIAIEQRSAGHNPRSTVGTVTEIYDYLRLLYARIGVPYCHLCGREIHAQTIDAMVETLLQLPENSRLLLMAPIARGKKGEFQKELKKLLRDGYTRVRVDGTVRETAEDIVLDKNRRHDIDVIVDRLVMKPGIRGRLRDSLEMASRLSDGLVRVHVPGREEMLFSELYACPDCGVSLTELTPRMFSFNSPYGACPDCTGLGTRMFFDEDLVVPDRSLSLREGAIAPWAGRHSLYYFQMLGALAEHYDFDINTPFNALPESVRQVLLHGSGKEKIRFHFDREGRRYFYVRPFEGILNHLDRRYRETTSNAVRNILGQYINLRDCPTCGGARLKKESLAVTVGARNIHELCSLTIGEAAAFIRDLPLTSQEKLITERIVKEIRERLQFLLDVGMDYLSLARAAGTLSGGEAQRIRLATQIGSGLVGVLYVLDEPTVGLHQRDNLRLIATLKRLRDLGNTVLVVEHKPETIAIADHAVDLGPGAGSAGGEVVFEGTVDDLRASDTLTGRHLGDRATLKSSVRKSTGAFKIRGANSNNLQDVDVDIPLGVLVVVTGVAGSGKSSLIDGSLSSHDDVVAVDQGAIKGSRRSNPATYTGLLDPIRKAFAKANGVKPALFSANSEGACPNCNGAGVIYTDLAMMAGVTTVCEVCEGKRFQAEVLEYKFGGRDISEVLAMSVSEAEDFFGSGDARTPAAHKILDRLADVGLGYLSLGQPLTTLSGGERQRLKLATQMADKGDIYVLDEPTTGLHLADIAQLLGLLDRLVDSGKSVVVIEHHQAVMAHADWIIDLGPGAGHDGGKIVFEGTPADLVADRKTLTGQHLATYVGADGRA